MRGQKVKIITPSWQDTISYGNCTTIGTLVLRRGLTYVALPWNENGVISNISCFRVWKLHWSMNTPSHTEIFKVVKHLSCYTQKGLPIVQASYSTTYYTEHTHNVLGWLLNQVCCVLLKHQHMYVCKHIPMHIVPSPLYPVLHAHVKDPSVLVQEALVWQGDWMIHSSMSGGRRL